MVFPLCFFKKKKKRNWSTIKFKLCEVINLTFMGHIDLNTLNQTLIVLIPKVDNPENISQFRSISLCNMIMKCMSKIIVARLNPFMDS